MRRHCVVGNWKMHGGLESNQRLLQEVIRGAGDCLAGVEAAVCVPYPYFGQVRSILAGSELGWGAQNVSEYGDGACTGEVSVGMLNDFGCRYVIVGHSERRSMFAESDEAVAAKFAAAVAGGLRPVLCVGETLAQRDAGETLQVVTRQLGAVLRRTGAGGFGGALVAYEPVWAIGTGRAATPEQAQEVHAAIRSEIASCNAEVAAGLQVLYGGSVKPQNAAELFLMPDIDGALVGGASLVAGDFLTICRAASR